MLIFTGLYNLRNENRECRNGIYEIFRQLIPQIIQNNKLCTECVLGMREFLNFHHTKTRNGNMLKSGIFEIHVV
jgi:hypothetical protein